MNKRKILFVDDELNVLKGLQRMLQSKKNTWDMAFTTSVSEALAMLRQDSFDAVVLDIKMPGTSGLEMLTEIKSDPKIRDIEVVMLTALKDHDLKHKSLDLGATDLLNKPVMKEDLVARLNSVIRIKSYRDELRSQNAQLEREFTQSQKMEVVGMLAAGVVHDLNNILTSIVGYSELSEQMVDADSDIRKNLDIVKNAGERARKLVQQIVRFSKQNDTSCKICPLGTVIDECLELLHPSIPTDIKIEWERPKTDKPIVANTTQIHQILMNLCINAIHAMSDKGILRISLVETKLDKDSLPNKEIQPGQYIKLGVSDTGTGMDQSIIQNIFKPLFTTKGNQGGTGLGLSVVQRIVKKHGGQISVESTIGKGTTFNVYFPCTKNENVPMIKEGVAK